MSQTLRDVAKSTKRWLLMREPCLMPHMMSQSRAIAAPSALTGAMFRVPAPSPRIMRLDKTAMILPEMWPNPAVPVAVGASHDLARCMVFFSSPRLRERSIRIGRAWLSNIKGSAHRRSARSQPLFSTSNKKSFVFHHKQLDAPSRWHT